MIFKNNFNIQWLPGIVLEHNKFNTTGITCLLCLRINNYSCFFSSLNNVPQIYDSNHRCLSWTASDRPNHYIVFGITTYINKGVVMVWSYGSWIYYYLCNQCLLKLKLWVWIPFMTRCTQYNITWSSLSLAFGRSVVFSTNTIDRYDIAEILLKVTLNSIVLYP